MTEKQYVYQYNDGTFYSYRGEAASYEVIHKTVGIESAHFFDRPIDEVFEPQYCGGKWLEVEVSYSSKEYKWPEEPTEYKCGVCKMLSSLDNLNSFKASGLNDPECSEFECPHCYCTDLEEYKEEKVR